MEQTEQARPGNGTQARFAVRVHVTLKPVVNDPQGLAVRDALHHLGYGMVDAVRVGKVVDLEIQAADAAAAEVLAVEMARRLLANPVIEQFDLEVPRPL